MKAIVYTQYGPPDVLQLQEVARPEPMERQVLVRVMAASVNALDYRRFESISLMGRWMETVVIKATRKVLGADIAGTVETVGAAVTRFRPGDAVFGVSAGSVGGFAEYACAQERSLALKPANVPFEAAAAVPVAGITALQALRDHGKVRSGQQVFIYGAGGGAGTLAVQIARAFGAEVTAVCSTRSREAVRAVGADHILDYTREDFTQSGRRYDLIAAVNGYRSILTYRKALKPGGRYVVVGGAIPQILQGMLLGPLLSMVGNKKMGFMGIAQTNPADLETLAGLLEAGKIVPVIDRRYPLSETAEAIRYLVKGHARGKVVITVADDPPA